MGYGRQWIYKEHSSGTKVALRRAYVKSASRWTSSPRQGTWL